MPTYKLTYFNGRGRGEVARLVFAKAGVQYEDVRTGGEQWQAMKEGTPFGQLPILEVDGHVIGQSFAIARFLGKRFGLYGKNEFEEAKIDTVCMSIEDINKPLHELFREKDETQKAEIKKRYEEEQLPGYLKFMEKMLQKNADGKQFFVGDSMTVADIYFFHMMSFIQVMGICIEWDKYPGLKNMRSEVESDPKIADWIQKRPETKM